MILKMKNLHHMTGYGEDPVFLQVHLQSDRIRTEENCPKSAVQGVWAQIMEALVQIA